MIREYATLSMEGQLVIPRRLRDQAGFAPGDRLVLEWNGECVELRKVVRDAGRPQPSVVRELLGKYRLGEVESVRELRNSAYGKIDC